MLQTNFEHPFQLSTRSLDQAAVLAAAGFHIGIIRQAGNQRCLFYVDDCKQSRELLHNFENRLPIPISAKDLLQQRTELSHRARKIAMEGV